MKKQFLLTLAAFFFVVLGYSQPGLSCNDPIVIAGLPFQTTDNTSNYSDTIDTPQGSLCGAVPAGTNYLAGNEVFYSFTPVTSGPISLTMTPMQSNNSSIFVYGGCAGVGATCIAGSANTNTAVRVLNLSVTAGTEYIIVISSSAASQTVGYSLIIQSENCSPRPTNGTASNITLTSAVLDWFSTGFSSWEVEVQPLGAPVPAAHGETVSSTSFVKTGLSPATQYQYWVRAKCSGPDDLYTSWAGPYPFNTMVCNPDDMCNFTFRMTDSAGNGWNNARMQIRQNGIVVATIGSTFTSGAGPIDVNVSLCKNVPYDVYWTVAGIVPQQCALSIINSFGQPVFTKAAGEGSPGTVLYNGIVNCDVPVCDIIPTDVEVSAVTPNTATINWTAPATSSWDLYIVAHGGEAPTVSSVPTHNDISENPYTVTLLEQDTAYDAYIRTNCEPLPSEWSQLTTFSTAVSCVKPFSLTVTNIQTTAAVLNWNSALPDDNSWEILLVAGFFDENTPLPAENPVLGPGSFLFTASANSPFIIPQGTLQPATIYAYYIRTVCGPGNKSKWTSPIIFNTTTCEPQDKCNYKFIMTDSGSNGWNGARILVRQNGIVIATIGATITGPGPTTFVIPLCNGVPFDLYWSVAGTAPAEIGVSVQNPYADVIYTKLPGLGNPLEVIYSTVGNCTPPTCPKPSNLIAQDITTTSALLSWTETGNASNWEIYLVPTGAPIPQNGSPVGNIPPSYIADTNPFPVTGLQPQTSYVFYVRAICSPTDIGTWTILNPKTFVTRPVNDECASAIPVPVNQTANGFEHASGSTLGASESFPDVACTVMGNNDDDVWFSFVASSQRHIISISNISGTADDLRHALYAGSDCDNLTQLYCSSPKQSLAENLIIGMTYKIRINTAASSQSGGTASFDVFITTPPVLTNDECANAIPIAVNSGAVCSAMVYGSIIGATASPQASSCLGSENDDVWFSFVATSSTQVVSLVDVSGTTTDLNFSVYSGNCDNLQLLYCSPANSLSATNESFIIGQSYLLRVWSASAAAQQVTFGVCVKTVSSCGNSEFFCGSTMGAPYIYANTVGIPNTQQVGCLGSIPNPTYYTLRVGVSGPLAFNISQFDSFDANGQPVGAAHDVDFIAWGPFNSPQNCDMISFTDCPTCPNNTINPEFYPFGNIVDCSYDASFTETMNIPDGQAGEYYILLITNFSNNDGYIKLEQTNFAMPDAGSTTCVDKIRLLAFIDENNNGVKDNNEVNFSQGSFLSQMNNTGPFSNIGTPDGVYEFYDLDPTNTYDFGFQLYPEYAAYYAAPAVTYNDVAVQVGLGTSTLYFPITVLQSYDDVSVGIVPLGLPVPGFNYTNKIVFRNQGLTPVSGTLTFAKDPAVTISSVDVPGTVTTPAGFTYNFTALAPSEIRTVYVSMYVPPIPTVNINDVLSNTAAISIAGSDINLLNNFAVNSQIVVASYDPNDKMESHSGQIDIGELNQDGYLFYTIRFQNTGTLNAMNVRLEDIIDQKLDETSIRMVDASHVYSMERVGNQVVWNFSNILLPTAASNEEGSKGYITFRIKPKPGFSVGDIIENTADIYFDTNPAIVTNTVSTEVSAPLGIPTLDASNVILYPNPANTVIRVRIQNTAERLERIVLYDVLGKAIKTINNVASRETSIDVSAFSKGIYMVEIITDGNMKLIKKLVVN